MSENRVNRVVSALHPRSPVLQTTFGVAMAAFLPPEKMSSIAEIGAWAMPDHPPIDEFARRELTVILGGMIVAGVLVVLLTWYLIDFFSPHDPSDPLAKAGGLRVERVIRK